VQETGFLGTAAMRAADITLLLEMGMGVGLLVGALLARRTYPLPCSMSVGHRAP